MLAGEVVDHDPLDGFHRLIRDPVTADGPARLAALGRTIGGPPAWRVAVAYELISRIGWRSEHHTQTDPDRLLPACTEFLDLPTIQ
jgi:hypothetical protein